MKSILKSLISLSLLLGLFACSSLPTEEDSSSSVKSSVQFTMQNIANSANSNILFSSTESETPSKVALTYKKSGEEAETSTTIELTAFGSSYITDDVLSLYEGNYEVTKFDVLNDEGTTIYSTPVSGSDIATNLNISTALAYGFEVKEGKISKVDMQVVAVTDTTDPADFGHAAFTFDKVDFNKFYVEVLVLDETEGWVYTTAQVEVKNAEGTTIKTANIDGKMNKVIVANSDSYKITISKDGYASQEFSFTKAKLEAYENEAMVVKLKASTISTEGLVAYYPFNGNANDESGNENNGTVYGAALATDKFGNENSAYNLDGNDDYIKTKLSLETTSNNTFSVWSLPYSTSSYRYILLCTDGYYGGHNCSILISGEYWAIFNGNTLYECVKIDVGKWQFLVAVFDKENNKVDFYKDGVLCKTVNELYSNYNSELTIGRSDFGGGCQYFPGKVDDIRIYNRALSQEEVTALYNAGN